LNIYRGFQQGCLSDLSEGGKKSFELQEK